MSGQKNYQKTLTINASPQAVYQALTSGFDQWWTPTQGQYFSCVGDTVKFTFPPQVSYWTFMAKTLTPDSFIELECIEAHHIMLDQLESSTTEWLGSTLQWRLEGQETQTHIHFTHNGLTPELDCYTVCEAGWDFFFMQSLKAYLETGKGTPHHEARDTQK